MSENLRKKYRHIVAWGSMLGSYKYYVDDQVQMAEEMGAPEDAVFIGPDNVWKTYRDIESTSTRERIDAILARMERQAS